MCEEFLSSPPELNAALQERQPLLSRIESIDRQCVAIFICVIPEIYDDLDVHVD